MSEWPEHSAELARKAFACLEDKARLNQAGELSDQQLLLAADVLSEVTQGLIPDEDWKTIDQVRQELKEALK